MVIWYNIVTYNLFVDWSVDIPIDIYIYTDTHSHVSINGNIPNNTPING